MYRRGISAYEGKHIKNLQWEWERLYALSTDHHTGEMVETVGIRRSGICGSMPTGNWWRNRILLLFILLGPTPKLGVATNVQDRLIALRQLDCSWKPSEEERAERYINKSSKIKAFRSSVVT